MKRLILLAILSLFVGPLFAMDILACIFCNPGTRNQDTLGEEFERANVVFYGRALESTLLQDNGAGKTRFQIERILKDNALLTDKKSVVLDRYVLVPNAKDPPHFLVFCLDNKNKLDWYYGPAVRSEALVDYVAGAVKVRKEGRISALQYYFRFFDHADAAIADDALREYARASDQDVSEVRRLLPAEKVRSLLEDKKTRADNLPLLAYLLGGCGTQRDAQLLRELIDRSDSRMIDARDGLLAGYASLQPREGWDLIRTHVADPKRPLLERIAAIRSLRFCYTLKVGDYRSGTLRCCEAMLSDANVADFAIEDLRRWQLWDLSAVVFAQYDKKSHAAPITRRTILRYAVSCPLTQARQFVDGVRMKDPQTVREIEAGLQDEK